MTPKSPSGKFRFLPLQFIEINGEIVLQRGATKIQFKGGEIKGLLRHILSATAKSGLTLKELLSRFNPHNQKIVESIVNRLSEVNFIQADDTKSSGANTKESHLDIFFWQFGEKNAIQALKRLNEHYITILGVNFISRQLVSTLGTIGIKNLKVVDDPLLRNVRLYDDLGYLRTDLWPGTIIQPEEFTAWSENSSDSFDCLVITSDFGGQKMIREWNKFCYRQHKHFLPILLQNCIGYVGPLVIPNETACYECLFARTNSHLSEEEVLFRLTETEDFAFNGQITSAFHPSMASILGDIAALELTKHYSKFLPMAIVGSLIECNLMSNELTTRRVLKLPRCKVCSPMNIHSSLSIEKTPLSASTSSD